MPCYHCCKVILFILLVCVGITVCDRSHSRFYRHPLNAGFNRRDPWNRTPNIAENEIVAKDKVNISVYYETLCPASIDFIVSQLGPAVEKLSTHLDVHLIPYGHATTRDVRGRYSFDCQHGRAECNGNMLHACTLYAVQNRTEAVLFNTCLMKYHGSRGERIADFIPVLNWCGHKQRVLTYRIWDCLNSSRGSTLLKEYGEETHALRPEYVPYLVLDGINNEEANDNLLLTVCNMLQPIPSECNFLFATYE